MNCPTSSSASGLRIAVAVVAVWPGGQRSDECRAAASS
jgi:hypothetical protein